MNYKDTTAWMFNQLPMYQNKGKVAYKKDLTNILKLLKHLNHPEQKFSSVHVAGTNGKGSSCHMIASILQEAGYKVGLYTSPHLKDFRERIKINGRCVSKQFVIQFIKSNKIFLETNSLSFFELTVGMAFDYFSKQNVDIAVIEVGMGGRLDSTNTINPLVSLITNIGFDHTQFLGNTLQKIAYEKAGIIKRSSPVIISEKQLETKPIFEEVAKKMKSKIVFADAYQINSYKSDLKGSYQAKNIKGVIKVVDELILKGYKISETQLKNGLLQVIKNTGLLGRWQELRSQPKVICDTAHNKEGISYVLRQIESLNFNALHCVLGFVKDKNIEDLIELFPKNAKYYFCQPEIQRALDKEEVQNKFSEKGIMGNTYQSVTRAYEFALSIAQKEDLIFIGGSTFVVSEIL